MLANTTFIAAICLIGFIALAYPISLFLGARRGREAGDFELWRRAGRRARNPWQSEDESLEALAKEVDKFRGPKAPDVDSPT
ncbi:MAG: hypothetical protein DWG76_04800 [Chloroflexi bacterium]|nr:hypothetical protein [Chloroflexota bacterium]MQC26755.1 hypothetical protein [Chloroflexota bacterium]